MTSGRGRWLLRSLPWLLAGCVFNCEEDSSSVALKESTAASLPPESQEAAKLEPLPRPAGPAVPWQSFTGFAPDTLSGYTATGPVEGRTLPVPGGGEISAVKRSYEKDGAKFELEILDALYAPAVRQVVKKMGDTDRSTESVVMKGASVQGHPAIVQWSEKTRAARVGVMLDDRYLVNIMVMPVSGPDPAIELVGTLALNTIAKLQPPPPPEAAPAKAATTEAAAKPAAAPTPGEQVAPSPPAQ